ncbi:NADPH:quinone reductase [Microdochium nivale]|nr:NADPH:quinone reductase [Microdochium nivale]
MAATNTRYIVPSRSATLESLTGPALTASDLASEEVLVRLRAVAVNPADYKMIQSGYRVHSWPLVAGLDGAGVVVAVGSDVARFATGDAVLAAFVTGERSGSFQGFAVVDEMNVARKPASWTFEEAASVAVCYITALVGLGKGLGLPLPFLTNWENWQHLRSQSQVQAGIRSVLVLGGSSGVGAATIQLLRLALPDSAVIVATSSPKHYRRIENHLGATKAVDRSRASLVPKIKQASPGGHGVDAIFDAVGASAVNRNIFAALRHNGPKRYAQVWTGEEEGAVPEGVKSMLFRSRDLPTLKGHAGALVAVEKLLEDNKYKLPLPVKVINGRGLEALKKGLQNVQNGVSREKVIVIL